MKKIVFTEEFCSPENLYPFTLIRQIQDIRVGILTIREKWERMLGAHSWDKKEDNYKDSERSVYLDEIADKHGCLMIHANILPDENLISAVKKLKGGELLTSPEGEVIAYHITRKELIDRHKIKVGKAKLYDKPFFSLKYPWHIFQLNDAAIRLDFRLITRRRKSAVISKTNKVVQPDQIFVEKGAKVEHCVLNASSGPIYIGPNAEVMEGTVIRGPFAMGENSCLKAGTKIYGATTLGPYCVGGGEIKNSVLMGYSNKAHEGYLGDSVIGEWCNLGAGTCNSNLKNNASEVTVLTPHGEISAGLKCGVIMGDYCRTAILTAMNSGTVIGIGCHVFGQGLTPKTIPNFSWGYDGVIRYDPDKFFRDLECWKGMKGKTLTDSEISKLKYLLENS
ncbi:MAG: putative sugar nucleotidyl transferase [Chitinophagaceae bacterium]|nr:putative sugar nucleotidyl transferase [Chitinophagaceae bacterium]